MPLKQISESVRGSLKVIKDTLTVLKEFPEVTAYPYLAGIFISITFPLVSSTVFANWYRRVFTDTNGLVPVPHKAHAIIGLVGFWAFYSALITAYFTCAVSISVIAKLEGHKRPPFYGLLRVARHVVRVTRFALLSVFFFPLGIYSQRRKLPAGWLGVFGSSLTLHMAQVAPAILTSRKNVDDTIRDSIDTLGRAWRESLVLKVAMYILVFLIVILPKLIQKGLFGGHTASNIGWIVSIELGASSLVAFKVANSIFTAVMYHQARSRKN